MRLISENSNLIIEADIVELRVEDNGIWTAVAHCGNKTRSLRQFNSEKQGQRYLDLLAINSGTDTIMKHEIKVPE